MKTLEQLREYLKDLLSFDLDNFKDRDGQTPSDIQLTDQINFGLRWIGSRVYLFDPSITLTLTAETASYDLRDTDIVSRKVIEAIGVVINGNTLRAADRRTRGMWKFGEVERSVSNWRADTSGTPDKAWQIGTTLHLHRKPTAAIVSTGSNYIVGHYMPADLVDGQDDTLYPDLPEELHEPIAQIAAIYAADPSVSEAEGINRLGRYNARAIDEIDRFRKRNMRLAQDWGTVPFAGYADYVRY